MRVGIFHLPIAFSRTTTAGHHENEKVTWNRIIGQAIGSCPGAGMQKGSVKRSKSSCASCKDVNGQQQFETPSETENGGGADEFKQSTPSVAPLR